MSRDERWLTIQYEVRNALYQLGLSERDLAFRSGLDRKSVERLLNGSFYPAPTDHATRLLEDVLGWARWSIEGRLRG